MASRAINIHTPLTRPARGPISPAFPPSPSPSPSPSVANRQHEARRILRSQGNIIPSAMQESSTATVTDEKEGQPPAATAAAPPAGRTAEKPKKEPAKDLLPLMEEDVIPALRASLEAQEDLSQIELSFHDNRLEGSFLKEGIPHFFWAFFPNGTLTGPKGFSLSSYASGASTVEPFLIDEKRITAKHVVFWVEKRLAAQGIIPVWKE